MFNLDEKSGSIRSTLTEGDEIKWMGIIGDLGLTGTVVAALTTNKLLFVFFDSSGNEKDRYTFSVNDIPFIEVQGFPYYRTTVLFQDKIIKIDTNSNIGGFKYAVSDRIKNKYNSCKEAIKSAENISEIKYTCNSCGNIWFVSKQTDSGSQKQCCGWFFYPMVSSSMHTARWIKPSICPKCNSSNTKKETVNFKRNQ